jgi:large subunit ribosomal protein L53
VICPAGKKGAAPPPLLFTLLPSPSRAAAERGDRRPEEMLKFLSKVVVEYNPLDPRKAAAVELLAQCNGRKAKDSNPACSVELRRLPTPPVGEDPKAQPPPRVLVTYVNGSEEAFIAADGATAQGMRDQILSRGRLLETEQLFREAGEKWPVVIPEEELGMSFPGIKVRLLPCFLRCAFRRTPSVLLCFLLPSAKIPLPSIRMQIFVYSFILFMCVLGGYGIFAPFVKHLMRSIHNFVFMFCRLITMQLYLCSAFVK